MARDFTDLKDGDTLAPYHLNIIYRELRRLRKMTVGPPLSLRGMDGNESPPQLDLLRNTRGSLAVANGAITARSGTTPGTGNVDLYYLDVTSNTLTDYGETIAVYYASSKTMTSGNGIDSGMYCWVEWDADQIAWVGPLDCA